MRKKLVCLLLVMVLVLTSSGIAAFAGQPDRTYTYEDTEAVPSTNIYKVKKIVDETIMSVRLLNPTDIFVDNSDRVFILDEYSVTNDQNVKVNYSRVLILNKDYTLFKEMREFVYGEETLRLAAGAKGLFFRESNKSLYIADTDNHRVIVSDLDGNVSKIYVMPVDEMIDPATRFMPQKLIVDNMGIMYVASGEINTGAMMIDSANNFLGFYGTNKLKMTSAMQIEFMWRKILTDKQNSQSAQSYQPVQFLNLFWSEDRFIYAVSPIVENMASTVVKLNALGKNVFPKSIDFYKIQTDSGIKNMQLLDMTVDNEGVFTVMDATTGRLFQYDENCNLLAIFGGIGYQKGLFTRATSIECDSENNLLVLDSTKATITVMEQTYYGKMIRTANNLYNEGRYQESIEPWEDVLRMNANFTRAYVGLGKAYIGMGEYEQAMEYFQVGKDKDGYAEAKAALRDETVREYFGLVAAVVIIAMIAILGYDQIKDIINRISWAIIRRRGE